MIIQCPECRTKYKIDDSKLKQGIKLKCTKCQHIFSPDIPEEDLLELDLQEEERSVASQESESEASGEQIEKEKEINTNIEGEENEKQEQKEPEEKQASDETEFSDDLSLDLAGEEKADKKKKGKKKGLKIFLIISLLLLLFGGGGFAVYYFYPQIKQYIPGLNNKQTNNNGTEQKQELNEEKIKNISLENVRQYFVTNEKIGQLFVLEGQAVNRFDKPKELIKLRATLYDDQGNVFKTKDFYCGNTVSLFQLQVLSQEELEASLNAKLGILTNNTFIKPGGATPFMVVFYAPPENVQEFGLEVIDVKNPPKK
jgi:predicted Zn finger-like uncharacterized protein